MEKHKFIGYFDNKEGNKYMLSEYADGFLQAFILLTAKAIQNGWHYQLERIEKDDGGLVYVDDIGKISSIFS
jgi:hypothetical protein